ncbi:hypothetical protein [Prochlorococcus sp. MIT 0916]|uniref:hypothetical protein n=1 Tax=Prochlorococcus sp. MIT 0916 TaxID=3082521 RepID=UPI0039B674DF
MMVILVSVEFAQAVESLFRIIDRGITDRENAEHIKEIKESLCALEGGRVVDI